MICLDDRRGMLFARRLIYWLAISHASQPPVAETTLPGAKGTREAFVLWMEKRVSRRKAEGGAAGGGNNKWVELSR